MIIEISGTGFHNMGAQLMLAAARQELSSWPEVVGVGISMRSGTRVQRDEAGVSAVARLDIYQLRAVSRILEAATSLAPEFAVTAVHAIKPSRVDALLDASGFALGDQHGPLPARKKALVFRRYAAAGKPVVLLPQAFGPFDRADVAAEARSTLEHADLIFARDVDSLNHLRQLKLRHPTLALAPDFTNLLAPPPEPQPPTVIVIPNVRMTQMVEAISERAYVAFLRTCTVTALEHGYRVVLLAHERLDRRFAAQLDAEFDDRVTTQGVDDPIRTKAFVGGASLVISSRYHGLVNALSQGVPAIGTSWSHKYPHLFGDYGCSDALWDVDDAVAMSDRLATWLEPVSLARRRHALEAPAASLKHSTMDMWSTVRELMSA